VLVEKTIDTPNLGSSSTHGGTVTVTIQSVTASNGATVLTWAVRWDDSDAPDDASFEASEFFPLGDPPMLVDGAALKLYYPLCPESDWREAAVFCGGFFEVLYWPHEMHSEADPALTNHQALEAWAVFPGLDEGTKTIDVTLPGGLPAFPALPVTWE
jgi:hypothetical protein